MSKKFILRYPKYQSIVEQYLSLDEFSEKATETLRGKRVTIIAFCNYLGDNGVESISFWNKIEQSMSRVGHCIDNGPTEGFWGILKTEAYALLQSYTKTAKRESPHCS